MSQTISLRLPDVTAERLKLFARRSGRSVNEMGAASIEEWLRQNEFADIEFRSFNGERHACLKGALQIWQVIMIARRFQLDPEKTAEYFQMPTHRIQAALNYYEAYPEEIDQAIADNDIGYEELKRLLPGLRLFEVPRAVLEEKKEEPERRS